MAEPIMTHYQHHESLEDRVALLMAEHTLPVGDGSTYFGHITQSPPISYQGKDVEQILDIQLQDNSQKGNLDITNTVPIDWTPKDIQGLRKEVERLEARTKAILNTLTEHLSHLDKKRKSLYKK